MMKVLWIGYPPSIFSLDNCTYNLGKLILKPIAKILPTKGSIYPLVLLQYITLGTSYTITSLQDGYCHNKAAVCGARLSNYTKIPSGDEDSLRVAIATKGPVAVAIDASHKSFSFYSYGVYYEKECGMCMDIPYSG